MKIIWFCSILCPIFWLWQTSARWCSLLLRKDWLSLWFQLTADPNTESSRPDYLRWRATLCSSRIQGFGNTFSFTEDSQIKSKKYGCWSSESCQASPRHCRKDLWSSACKAESPTLWSECLWRRSWTLLHCPKRRSCTICSKYPTKLHTATEQLCFGWPWWSFGELLDSFLPWLPRWPRRCTGLFWGRP